MNFIQKKVNYLKKVNFFCVLLLLGFLINHLWLSSKDKLDYFTNIFSYLLTNHPKLNYLLLFDYNSLFINSINHFNYFVNLFILFGQALNQHLVVKFLVLFIIEYLHYPQNLFVFILLKESIIPNEKFHFIGAPSSFDQNQVKNED